ncbi:PAS domain-containing hybrid sensor histidine kinase/response regulator [Actomonas aquatica]|uniref:histidine kinase n=1 Tax=Actomonas aquatica TaxID=2866162 RepID=A0ABZ1C622_9BACT|nr:ATP-binding protein [Opitutus sp. WL0086]WRQ86961.1 ATP-binding protein [Opitutus sp. WL0086]
MPDPVLLSRFLALAHTIAALGLGGWYLGLIPRGLPERRFIPLGLYMLATVVASGLQWGLHYFAWIQLFLGWLQPGLWFVATLLLGGAFFLHHKHRPVNETWPWRTRVCHLAHYVFAFVMPPVLGSGATPTDRSLGLALAIFSLVWLVFSGLPVMRRRGHFLHWSMGVAVLGTLALSWIALTRVENQGLRNRDNDLVSRVEALAELLDARLIDSADLLPDRSARLRQALESMCSTSNSITGAFILPANNPSSGFIARVISPDKRPVPIMASAAHYARFASSSQPSVARFRDLEDGGGWHLAIAPVRRFEDNRVIALVGLLAPRELLAQSLAEPMLVTDLIVFFVTLVIYGSIAGYLQGVVRVWQRDILLQINAEHSRKLLGNQSANEVAHWLVREVQRRLNLVHASFWVYSPRRGELGFRPVAAHPSFTSGHTGHWHSLQELPPAWHGALSRRQSIEGDLRELGQPLPGMAPDSFATPWCFVENVELTDRLYGSLVLVFSDRNLVARTEVRSALHAICNAFSSYLVRQERSEHLAAAEERLRTIIETSPDGFWDADFTRGRFYRSNRWWQMLGHEPPSDPSDPLAHESLIEPEDLAKLKAHTVEALDPGRKFRRHSYRARHHDGSWRWIESNTVELRAVHGPAERALGFDRDVTERHDYEQRLREAAESSARANRAKSEFLATMNHELRTPLNSVIGFATILDRSPLNETQREWVNSMRTSAEQLLGLISDVLDFSRIEAGRLELEVAPFELRRATEQALEPFSRLATEKEIALHHEFRDEGHPSWVLGDTLRLRQILTNLVGNALKFTQTGHVRLRVSPLDHDRWRFDIDDTGPGIPPDRIDTLFRRFNQLDASSTRAHGGTGLGLAISRELAIAMNGDITATSTLDEGSTFRVIVHLPPAPGETRRYTDVPVSLNLSLPVFQPDEADLSALNNCLTRTGCTFIACETPADLHSFIQQHHQPGRPLPVIFPRAFRPAALAAAQSLATPADDRPLPPLVRIAIQVAVPDSPSSSPFEAELSAPLRRRDVIQLLDGQSLQRASRIAAATSSSASPAPTPPPDTPIDSTHTAAPDSKPSAPPPVSALRVLVAEDHPVNREVVRTMLEQLGLNAHFAENGQVAIELLTNSPYDLALIDIQMPVVDGFGVAHWVRHQWSPDWSPPRLVAVTANATRGDRERCIQAGMDEYVAKPITFATLSKLVSLRTAPSAPTPQTIAPPSPSQSSMPTASSPSDSPTSSPGDHLVDWEAFDSILTFTSAADNPEVLRRIISTYHNDLHAVLDEVAAMPPEDQTSTRRHLHKLKGSTGSLALMGVVSTIKQLHDPKDAPPAAERERLIALIREESQLALEAVFKRYPWLQNGPDEA